MNSSFDLSRVRHTSTAITRLRVHGHRATDEAALTAGWGSPQLRRRGIKRVQLAMHVDTVHAVGRLNIRVTAADGAERACAVDLTAETVLESVARVDNELLMWIQAVLGNARLNVVDAAIVTAETEAVLTLLAPRWAELTLSLRAASALATGR